MAANYRITAAGADGVLGTTDDQVLAISAVEYNPTIDRITVRTADLLFEDHFRLELDGDNPTTDSTPGIADLAGNHVAGGDYVADLDLTSLGMVEELIAKVEALGLDTGPDNSLIGKLNAVITLLGVDTPNDGGVLAVLGAFQTGVNHWFDRGEINQEDRDELIADSDLIILGVTSMAA